MSEYLQKEETALPMDPTLGPSMYLVRIGTSQSISVFVSTDVQQLRRNAKVICRSQRGIEAGVVLGPARHASSDPSATANGTVLRRMTPEDELLLEQIRSLSHQAAEKCSLWLAEHSIEATLLDVEPLMDGKTLYFHFLSEVGPQVQQHLDSLVSVYQESVAASRFARLLEHGCGPGCGTELAENSCSTRGGCAVCAVSSACKKSG